MINIMCFDTETKEELLLNGYKLLYEKDIDGDIAYVFLNNGKSMKFDNKKIVMSNKMYF